MYDKKDFINILAFCTYLYVQKNMKNTYKYVLHNKKESIRFVKQTFKQVRMKNLKLLFRLLLLLLLISCEKEETLPTTTQNQQYTVKNVSKEEITTKPLVLEKIKQFQNKIQTTTNKNTYLSEIDSYIDTNSAKYIENTTTGDHSYIFPVFGYNTNNNNLKNLVIDYIGDNQYDVYLVEYPFTEQEYPTLNIQQLSQRQTKFYKIELDGSTLLQNNVQNKTISTPYQICIEVWEQVLIPNNQGDNIGGEPIYEWGEFLIASQCQIVGGGSGSGNGGSTGTGGNTSGTGGSAGSNTGTPYTGYNPIVTTVTTTNEGIINGNLITNFIDQLNYSEKIWWNTTATSQQKTDIITYLLDNKTADNTINNEALLFVNELINLTKSEITTDNQTFNFVLQAKIQNKMQSELDDIFLQSVNQYLAIDTSAIDPVVMSQLKTYFTLKCAVLRYNHPDWNDLKIYWEASKDIVHITLDVFGMVPIVGEVADLTNGVLYLIEGDGVNATLSFAATVPIAGWTATGSKYAVKIIEASGNVAYTINNRVRLTWKVLSNGIIDFGYSNQLRKVLGLTDSAFQAHHIIPWAFRNNDAVQKAAKSGSAFHMNEELNGIPIHTNFHFGSHPNYNNQVQQYLNSIPSNATPDQAYNAINTLINNIKTAIQNNPTTHINQLTF